MYSGYLFVKKDVLYIAHRREQLYRSLSDQSATFFLSKTSVARDSRSVVKYVCLLSDWMSCYTFENDPKSKLNNRLLNNREYIYERHHARCNGTKSDLKSDLERHAYTGMELKIV